MWYEYPDLQSCINTLSDEIGQRMEQGLAEFDTFTLAVSGGRSPIPLFESLSKLELDWTRVRVRLVDERYVPIDHADSNEALIRRHLLVGPAAKADFQGLFTCAGGLAAAVAAANAEFQRPDLCLLGMGEDGHTASIFPNARQFESAIHPGAAPYLHVTPPHAAHERISMSLAALLSSRQRILYISGVSKRKVLQEAETCVTARLPISYLAAEPGVTLDVHWHP